MQQEPVKLSERVTDTEMYYLGHSIMKVVHKWFDLWPCLAEISTCRAYKMLTWPSAHLYIKGKLIVLLITSWTTPSAAVSIANKHDKYLIRPHRLSSVYQLNCSEEVEVNSMRERCVECGVHFYEHPNMFNFLFLTLFILN